VRVRWLAESELCPVQVLDSGDIDKVNESSQSARELADFVSGPQAVDMLV
jgi:hypothetical protein